LAMRSARQAPGDRPAARAPAANLAASSEVMRIDSLTPAAFEVDSGGCDRLITLAFD
jgi:hypothetical protein